MRSRSLPLWVLLAALAAGCSSYNPRTIPDGDAAEAELPQLREELAADPDNPELNYRAGVAHYALGRMDEAADHLDRALGADPSLIEAAIVLSRIQEEKGQYAAAEATLLRAKPGSGGEKDVVEASLERVGRARNRERTRELLDEERDLDTRSIPDNTLAVHPFEADASAWELESLGKALANVLVTDLSQLEGLRLLERRKLQTLVDEIEMTGSPGSGGAPAGAPAARTPSGEMLAPVDQLMGVQQRLALLKGEDGAPFYAGEQSGEFDEATRGAIRAFQGSAGLAADGIPGPRTQQALEEAFAGIPTRAAAARPAAPPVSPADSRVRAGRLLGARRLMTGEYGAEDAGFVTVRARLYDTVDGTVGAALQSEQELAEFYRIPGDITVKTADALHIDLSAEERRRILSQPPPTKSLAAFLAFGRGLDLEDRGQLDDAQAAYAEAVRLDPDFDLARDRVKKTEISSATVYQVLGRIRRAGGAGYGGGSGGSGGSKEAMARAVGSVGLAVQEDATKTDDPATRDPQADGPPTGVVNVTGQIPVNKR